MNIEIKIIFSIIAVIIGTWAFLPYFRDIISKKTKPHAFTWLIWVITQGTATVGIWVGGGGVGAMGLTVGTFLMILVFFMALHNGNKDITKSDIVILIIALLAIMVWWTLDNPVAAIILVSAIDLIGTIPTFRKTYNNPWTETALTWMLFSLANIFAILALESYNALTLVYIIVISSLDISLLMLILVKRRMVVKKESK